MGRYLFLIISFLFVCLFLPTIASAATAKIDKDTWVCSNNCEGAPYGNGIIMDIANGDSPNELDGIDEHYGLIRFPVSGPVTSATLKIPLWTGGFWGSHGPTFYFSLIRIGADWNEATVTWINRPSEASGYSQTINVPTASVPFAAYPIQQPTNPYIAQFDVTNYVNAVAAGTIQNHGFYLKGIAPNGPGAEYGVKTYAKEANEDDQGYIEYTPDPGGTPTPTPTPTPGGGGGGGSTPTPTPTVTPGGGGGGGTTPTPTPTPTITIISNTVSGIEELAVTTESCTTHTQITFRTTAESLPTLYYYTNSRVPNPGGGDQLAVGYQDNSTKMDGATGTDHSFALTGLAASSTYYFTLVLADGTQDYEHTFTTSAGPAACPVTIDGTGGGGDSNGSGSDGSGSPIVEITPQTLVAGFVAISTLGTLGAPLAGGLTGIGLTTWWFGVLSRRKKIRPWGRVVSTMTQDGVPGVIVTLIDTGHYNRVVNRTVSQEDGTFGFTAPPGQYVLRAEKAGYTFPSQHAANGYTGGNLTVDESGMVETDLPMDQTRENHSLRDSYIHLLLQLEIFRLPLLIFGTMTSIAFLIDQITIPILIFLFYYMILWFWEFMRNDDTRHLLFVTGPDGKPLAFASVRLKHSDGSTVFTRTTNPKGTVFILVPQGDYQLEITPPVDTGLKKYRHPLTLERGLLLKSLRITLKHA